MRHLILAAALLLPLPALAAPAPHATIPAGMVLLPRQAAEAAAQWIAAPNAETAVRLYAGLLACLADNPTGSTVRREGPDQCPAQMDTTAISANQGGTGTAFGQTAGFLYAGGDQMWCNAGATNLSGCIGRETDVGIFTGASAGERIGHLVVGYGQVQGAQIDAALDVAINGTSAAAWNFGLLFGGPTQTFPISASGTLIGAQASGGAMSAAYGINWSGVTFATASLALPGLTVDPTGNITITTPATGTAASYACFTSGGKLISSASSC